MAVLQRCADSEESVRDLVAKVFQGLWFAPGTRLHASLQGIWCSPALIAASAWLSIQP